MSLILDPQAEYTLAVDGLPATYGVRALSARDYAKFLADFNRADGDAVDVMIDQARKFVVREPAGYEIDKLPTAALTMIVQEFIAMNSVTPTDKKKSE